MSPKSRRTLIFFTGELKTVDISNKVAVRRIGRHGIVESSIG